MKEGEVCSLQEEKEKLIRNMKKSVKHLMEESVTKKVENLWFLHSLILWLRVFTSSPVMWVLSAAS